MLETVSLLGVKVSQVNLASAVRQIDEWVRARCKTYVCVAPVSTLVDCQRVKGYREVVNKAGMVTPDGMPVVWLLRAQGAKEVSRTYGPDLMRLVCDQGRSKGLKHFFLGATTPALEMVRTNLSRDYPGIRIVDALAPPFMDVASKASEDLLKRINDSGADIVWVALGSPKQDFWMYHNRPYLDAPVLVGVGAAFDFIAGVKPQAPRWVQRSGLEWLFRLCCEPGRLWRRYLIGNTLFCWHVLVDFLKTNTLWSHKKQ